MIYSSGRRWGGIGRGGREGGLNYESSSRIVVARTKESAGDFVPERLSAIVFAPAKRNSREHRGFVSDRVTQLIVPLNTPARLKAENQFGSSNLFPHSKPPSSSSSSLPPPLSPPFREKTFYFFAKGGPSFPKTRFHPRDVGVAPFIA